MSEFIIKSSTSDLTLVLSGISGDYFEARLQSSYLNVVRKVYAYTDAYGFADLMEYLASQKQPWTNEESWISLEGEFDIIATCNVLGHVTFKIVLSYMKGGPEEWLVQAELRSEFGQLEKLAKSAREFFGQSPD